MRISRHAGRPDRADRPGLTFTSIMARQLDVELINPGLPGAGRMELPMADVLAKINAPVYAQAVRKILGI